MAKKELSIETLVAKECAAILERLSKEGLTEEEFSELESEFRLFGGRIAENIQRTSSIINRYKTEKNVDETQFAAIRAYSKGESAPDSYKFLFNPKR